MDYEKAYKEALERARQFSEHPLQEDSANIVEYIFPELKESEDERIRKEIIEFLIHTNKYGSNEKCEVWLAWLEKQKWSEDDELMLTSFANLVDKMYYGGTINKTGRDKGIDWLESLKERMT